MKTNISIPDFIPHQSARQAHTALCSAIHIMDKAEQCSVLWFGDIMARKLYVQLGYSSMNQYAAQELKFSRTRSGDFIRLARRLEELPVVKRSLASGKLGYTKAREVIKVATPDTEKEWVQKAIAQPRRQLAAQVSLAQQRAVQSAKSRRNFDPNQGTFLSGSPQKPAASVPVRISLEMTPKQLAIYEALWEKLHKLGGLPANKADVILAAFNILIDSDRALQGTPVKSGPQTQIHIHHCPECEIATVQTSRGELLLSETDLEQAQCDALVSQTNKPNRSSIPPAVRREVLCRDRHICQAPGCTNSHFLEVHHINPRINGGNNRSDNLVTLCSGCHRIFHKKRLAGNGSLWAFDHRFAKSG